MCSSDLISSLLLAAWFAAALLLTPVLHTHGGGTDCHGACGSHSHDPAPAPADGPAHGDCPACQFAALSAVAPVVDAGPTPSSIVFESPRRPLDTPRVAPSILLPPSCGPPRA